MTKSKLKAYLKYRGYKVPRKFEYFAFKYGSRYDFVVNGNDYDIYSWKGDKLLYGPVDLERLKAINVQNKCAELSLKWSKQNEPS